ncbi:MAG: hypothetical protein QOE45_300 [Frankiaceae bacterium]|jgi:archaellum component FlaF (FlaF/FlaG flagellin family)|nr:hypothetical protein [Frankiaceae bacterium]
MKRTLLALALAATTATPAFASAQVSNGIVYAVTARSGAGLTAACTIVADRWTADYGPTNVSAVAVSPAAIWTRVRCTVTKNGTTYVDTERTSSGAVVTIVNERNGTIPVAGIQVCVEAESQLTVDSHPVASACVSG